MSSALKVLIIDDDAPIREVLSASLTAEGYTTIQAGAEKDIEAVQAVFLAHPDIDAITVDGRFKGPFDTEPLIRWLREHFDGLIIGLTGGLGIRNGESIPLSAMTDAGCDYVIMKPHFDELMKVLNQYNASRQRPSSA